MQSMASRPGLKRTPELAPAAQSPARSAARLFRGLDKDQIAHIMESAVVRRFDTGQTVIRCGEPARNLFLIQTGSVNYSRMTPEGHEILLTQLSEGETFGLGTLLEKPIGYIGTAATVRDTELYTWDHEWICRCAGEYPRLPLNALRIALEYIRLYSERHLALVSGSAEHRLTRTLMRLGARKGKPHPRGLEVHITNEHLASLADVHYKSTFEPMATKRCAGKKPQQGSHPMS
jgi:CRP/FNR family transcriptional regulator